MSDFGAMVDASTVEDAAETLLRAWETTYLAAVERQNGLDPQSLPRVETWATDQTFDWQAADYLPAVYIIAGDLTPTERHRTGYVGTCDLSVAVVCEGQDERDARRVSKRICTALRSALLGHQGFVEGRSTDVDWTGDEHATLSDADASLLLGTTEATFTVQLSLGSYVKGPSAPPEAPYEQPADDPTIAETHLNITQEASS